MQKQKYFINFFHGYFKYWHEFILGESYHLHSFLVAKRSGYNNFIAIVRGGIDNLKSDPNLKILKEKGIEILILDYKNIFNFILILLKYSSISFFNNTLFYFNSHEKLTYFGIIFSKIFSFGNIKNIFMSHTQPKRGGLGNARFKQFFQDKILFKFFVDRVRLNNITEKNFLLSNGILEKKLFVCPLVVDDHVFKKINDYQNRKDLLYFGQLSQKKNILNILKALKILIGKYPKYKDIKLNIIGKETDYFLKDDVEMLKLEDNIIKHGFLPLEDLNNVLNNFLIYLNDSKDEGQCVAVFQAALSGSVLCIPKIMSFIDVFEDKALFHEVGDIEKLAEDIVYCLENRDKIIVYNENCINMIKKEYNQNIIEEKMVILFTL